ncbi:MAG: protein kinase, partial [candidate division Zixibacteria bacterium]|nr:protein kinase [candidate division Zixibacteria bacterium]
MNQKDNDDKTQNFVPLAADTEVGHYRIIKKIGAGGMGEVFLAQDTKLDREVALKFLPSHLVSDKDVRTRFTREAKAAAKLNHPNIVVVHEVSEFNGRPYFAMEHVKGESLHHFACDNPQPLDKVVDLVIQICEGLSEAHSKGIVHRDIKSANIVVDDKGRPRLLDFGLATVRGEEKLTRTGSTIGTIAYMSPEQIAGKEIDARSDIFSLGVVLYELVTGRTPFKRDNNSATMSAIANDEAEPMARYKTGVSEDLERIVAKALRKDIKSRYQHVDDVLADLRNLSSSDKLGARSNDRKMVAVLPFENLGAADDEYFADGITEEITSRLAVVSGLGVISRTSALRFKGSKKSISEIGQELGVDYI